MQPLNRLHDAGASEMNSQATPELPSARFVWTLRFICSAALGISGYLAWTAFSMGEVFGCSGGDVFDCGHVLTSHWSKVFGIPVSIPAAGLYASLLALLAFARRKGPQRLHQMVWSGMTFGGVMAGLAALWFIGLQILVVEHLCTYCLIVHTCGIVLAGLVLTSRLCPRSLRVKSVAMSVLGVSILAGIQAATPKADQFEIVRYDDVLPSSNDDAKTAISGSELEVFAAPGEFIEAPVDITEAPIDVFEAPIADDGSNEATTAENPPTRSSDKSKPAETKPAVATTLLFIMPTRILCIADLLSVGAQESQENAAPPEGTSSSTSAAEGALDEQTKSEAGQGSADDEKPLAKDAAEATPEPPKRRLLTFAGNRFTLDVKQWPLLGQPEAKYVFVEMYDYTCPHCRNTHHAIMGALNKYGDNLAVLALPVPLNPECNPTVTSGGGGHGEACELARIAIAVWRLDAGKFREFHDWMFAANRTASAARLHAETLVDKERLKKELSSGVPGQYISRHVSLYQKVGSGQVPKLIFPSATLNGEVNSTSSLCSTIERELAAAKQ